MDASRNTFTVNAIITPQKHFSILDKHSHSLMYFWIIFVRVMETSGIIKTTRPRGLVVVVVLMVVVVMVVVDCGGNGGGGGWF